MFIYNIKNSRCLYTILKIKDVYKQHQILKIKDVYSILNITDVFIQY